MKKIEYLSPSAINLFKKDPEAYYIRYCTEKRLPDEPQTAPMAAGSAFDAYCKAYLHEKLFGKGKDVRFELDALYEAQVESHLRDTCKPVGQYLFEKYRESGALNDLLLDMQQAINEPRFEIEVRGVVGGYREGIMESMHGVTLLGKPDVFYINQFGASVIVDWKVNGYFSKYKKTPMKGYLRHRVPIVTTEASGFNGMRLGTPCRFRDQGRHKECVAGSFQGTIINLACYLEDLNDDWATQLSIYSWLCGCEIGQEFIVGIEQICCSPNESASEFPTLTFAEHRLRVRPKYQHQIFALAQDIWKRVHGDHFFTELSKEDSASRCAILDKQSEGINIENDMDAAFMDMTRRGRVF